MFSTNLHALVKELDKRSRKLQVSLATAESCTGGLVGALITETPGVSDWFYGSFTTYSNEAKQAMLNVSSTSLVQHGAVSEVIAREMLTGIFSHTPATVGIAITGIAGPGGGTELKPVGTVWFAWGLRNRAAVTEQKCFSGDRTAIRLQAVTFALEKLIGLLDV